MPAYIGEAMNGIKACRTPWKEKNFPKRENKNESAKLMLCVLTQLKLKWNEMNASETKTYLLTYL